MPDHDPVRIYTIGELLAEEMDERIKACVTADGFLRACLALLDGHDCRKSAAYVRRCRKSVQGALRHARRLRRKYTTR